MDIEIILLIVYLFVWVVCVGIIMAFYDEDESIAIGAVVMAFWPIVLVAAIFVLIGHLISILIKYSLNYEHKQ